MAGLRRTTADGVTQELTLLGARIEYSFQQQTYARIRTPQPLETVNGTSISLNESDDEIYVSDDNTDIFGGILRDVTRVGTEIELIADSFSRAARDAEPSGGSQNVTGTDKSIIQTAISDTPELSEGTIEQLESDLEFDFHHASPALRMKLVRQSTGGEIRYNPDKTVDYVGSLGSDKTSTTLSPSNQHFVETIRVDQNAGEVLANHLRVIGADGSSVNVVADDFNPDADREKWRRAYFRDTSDSSTLTKRGNTLLNIIGVPWTQVESTLTDSPTADLDPGLGDEYHVKIPGKDVDKNLRVTQLTHRIETNGEYFDATLSNRTEELDDELEKLNQVSRGTDSKGKGNTTKIYLGSQTQSIPGDGTTTEVEFSDVDFTGVGSADTSTNSITVPEGRYRITMSIHWSGSTAFSNTLRYKHESSTTSSNIQVDADSLLDKFVTVIKEFDGETTLTVLVSQDTGSSKDLLGSSTGDNIFLAATRVA